MSGALPPVVFALLAVVALTGCESNVTRSARIAQRGAQAIKAEGMITLGTPDPDVHVARTTLVAGSGGAAAVAVELENRGAAKARLPLVAKVLDARGAVLYRNDQRGLQPALQQLALVAGHRRSWWVDDQITTATPGKRVQVRLGATHRVARPPVVRARDVHFDEDAGGRFLTGTLVNRSGVAQLQLPVFAVAVRGGRVVAAGRALVAKLPAVAGRKPVPFRIFLVGDPRKARIELTVAATAR